MTVNINDVASTLKVGFDKGATSTNLSDTIKDIRAHNAQITNGDLDDAIKHLPADMQGPYLTALYGTGGRPSGVASSASADRSLGVVGPDTPVKIAGSPSAAIQLLDKSGGQINAVSKAAGNDGMICGGASAAAGIVLSSAKSPDAAKANANALRQTASGYGVDLTPREKAAIDALEKGTITPNDLAYLQQACYRVAKKAGGVNDPTGMRGPNVMAFLAEMRSHGGFAGDNVKMSFNTHPIGVGGAPADHITISVNGTSYNPQTGPAPAGSSCGSASLKTDRGAGGPPWQGEVGLDSDGTLTFKRMSKDDNNRPCIDTSRTNVSVPGAGGKWQNVDVRETL